MFNKNMIKLLVLFCITFSAMASEKSLPSVINICDDGDEFPPYTYYQIANKVKSNKVIGYSVDYFNKIFSKKKIKINYTLIPWPRCLDEVKSGKYDLALNATKNAERESNFILTESFFSVRTAYIYKKNKSNVKINELSDLKKRTLCGQTGYNYSYLGIEDKDIKYLANSFDSAIKMIKTERCDIITVDYEVLVGQKITGAENYINDPELEVEILNYVPSTEYYMLLSKAKDYSPDLKKFIDSKIQEFNRSKYNLELMKKYSN